MKKNQFQVQLNKKKIDLTAEQLVFYKQSNILEATDEKDNYYYLIFYKNKFINGAKTNSIRINSHVHHAFSNGIHFSGTHPLATQLIASQSTFHLLTFNQLFKNIRKNYPKLETVLIFSFFDSFTKPGSIRNLFKNTFYNYRRNGQIFLAYQVLKVYINSGHKDQFVQDMIHNMQFLRYETTYRDLKKIYEMDSINFELAGFSRLHEKESRGLLLRLYKEQNRFLDELAVRLDVLSHRFTSDNFAAIQRLLPHFPTDEQIFILQELNQTVDNSELEEKLSATLLASENPNDIVRFIMTSDYLPNEDQGARILTSFQQADPTVISSFFHQSNKRLLDLAHGNSQTLEKLINPFITAFLEDYDIGDILEWLTPFRDADYHLPTEQKLMKMQTLSDDPDKQFTLGELFIQFSQFEKAIDCFKWEMELHPKDPKPVHYLMGIYKELGQSEEAFAYEHLLVQMGK